MKPDFPTIGIVGAGLAGLMAGQLLRSRGCSVTVFDKGRRPGGRANTREHSPYRFDHGAQFFTVRDPRTRPYLDAWVREGVVEEWAGRLVRLRGDRMEPARESVRYVGVPGMIAVGQHLALGLDVRVGVRVGRLVPDQQGWVFQTPEGANLGGFQAAVVAVPAPQAVPLLSAAPELQARARAVEMAPCWAGMCVFAEPLDVGFDGAFVSDFLFSWMARDSSKPGRPNVESWVLHGAPGWTRENRDMDRNAAAEAMLSGLRERFGPLPQVLFQRAHRWGFALVDDTAGEGASSAPLVGGGALYDPDLAVGACGDWCWGGRMEGAILSGLALAERIAEASPQGGENFDARPTRDEIARRLVRNIAQAQSDPDAFEEARLDRSRSARPSRFVGERNGEPSRERESDAGG